VSNEHGLKKVRDSRKMPEGKRLVLGQLASNGQHVCFMQEEKGKNEEKQVLPGKAVEYFTPEDGVLSKIAYNTYLEVRDDHGLTPETPRGGAARKSNGEAEGESDENQTEKPKAESKPKQKAKSK
jgi:hypothetical protein